VDLKIAAAPALQSEREAVESVLGTPRAPREGRHLLLPALQAVQGRLGWVSAEALGYICSRLQVPPSEAYAVASFYAMLSLTPSAPAVARVCDDVSCRLKGATILCAEIEKILGTEDGPGGSTPSGPYGLGGHGGTVRTAAWGRTNCLGYCERGPSALVTRAGDPCREFTLAPATADRIREALEGEHFALDPPPRLPQFGSPGLRLLRRIGHVDPASLEDYRAHGGYLALAKAVEMGRDAVIHELKTSRLMGRGGAAFSSARKWEAVAGADAPRFLVCNADESEPGTFKDRVLLEEDPFAVVEAMTIAGFATGCERGFAYVRGEYPLAAERLASAVDAARAEGLLGEDVLGWGFGFDVEIRRGAGAYICGEETALFNSIEGFRGEPRSKPPYPVEAGLFGRPTLVHNVETLVNVPDIVMEAGESFAAVGTAGSTGTRLFCVSGCVARPGLYELPLGITLGSLLSLAGGVPGGDERLQAILLGGSAGSFLTPAELETPLSFEGTRAIGATLGSGAVVVFDDTVDLRGTLRRIAAFFRDESCGQCVPCRLGTARQEEILDEMFGRGKGAAPSDARLRIAEIGQAMRDASICGLGQTASGAILSALEKFPSAAGGGR
jgi:NADH-quinone oxidoreductase subunit F